MTTKVCPMRAHVDAHFAGTISEADEHALREHLATCDECRARYKKQLLLAKLDPEAPKAEDRIGRALGFEIQKDRGTSRERKSNVRFLAPGIGALALAAAIALFARGPKDPDFVPRGSGDVDAKSKAATNAGFVHVYRLPEKQGDLRSPIPVIDSIGKDDALSFAIENRDGKNHMMLFGVNERGRVYWFYPAWTNEADDPRAIEIATDANIRALPEAITHHFEGTTLHLHALFLDDAISVRAIEARLKDGALPLTIADARDHVTTYAITP